MDKKKMKKEFMEFVEQNSDLDITSKAIEHTANNAILIDSLLEVLFKNNIIKENEFRKLVNKRVKKKQNAIIDFMEEVIKDPKVMEKFKKHNKADYVG